MDASLNGQIIGIGYAIYGKYYTMNKVVEFDFEDGDVLEIRETPVSIILFNNFHLVNCGFI